MNVPARRFYVLLSDMRALTKQKNGEMLSHLCDVSLLPHLKREAQEEVLNKFYNLSIPETQNRSDKALDPINDYDVLAPSLKAIFQAKARFH